MEELKKICLKVYENKYKAVHIGTGEEGNVYTWRTLQQMLIAHTVHRDTVLEECKTALPFNGIWDALAQSGRMRGVVSGSTSFDAALGDYREWKQWMDQMANRLPFHRLLRKAFLFEWITFDSWYKACSSPEQDFTASTNGSHTLLDDFMSLRPSKMATDTVVVHGLRMIQQSLLRKMNVQMNFDSYLQPWGAGSDFDTTRKTKLLTSTDTLFVLPVNVGVHYAVLIVDRTFKKFVVYDSLSTSPASDAVLHIVRVLRGEDQFSTYEDPCDVHNRPQQTGGVSCGVFVLSFVLIYSTIIRNDRRNTATVQAEHFFDLHKAAFMITSGLIHHLADPTRTRENNKLQVDALIHQLQEFDADRGADCGPDRGADCGPDRGADCGPDRASQPGPDADYPGPDRSAQPGPDRGPDRGDSNEPAMTEFNEFDSDVVNEAFQRTQSISNPFRVNLRPSDVRCLHDGAWLNDEVVNLWMRMLHERNNLRCRIPAHFFNTFFYSLLYNRSNVYNYEAVKRWSRKFDLFSKSRVYIPVNLNRVRETCLRDQTYIKLN